MERLAVQEERKLCRGTLDKMEETLSRALRGTEGSSEEDFRGKEGPLAGHRAESTDLKSQAHKKWVSAIIDIAKSR